MPGGLLLLLLEVLLLSRGDALGNSQHREAELSVFPDVPVSQPPW